MGSGTSGKPDYHKAAKAKRAALAAVRVTYDNGLTVEYRANPNGGGLVDWDRLEPIQTNLTLADVVKRAEASGNKVETYTAAEVEERDEARRKERASRPDWELGQGIPGGNRLWRQVARRNRINDRAQKRHRRQR